MTSTEWWWCPESFFYNVSDLNSSSLYTVFFFSCHNCCAVEVVSGYEQAKPYNLLCLTASEMFGLSPEQWLASDMHRLFDVHTNGIKKDIY